MLDSVWSRWLRSVSPKVHARRPLVTRATVVEQLEPRQLLSATSSPHEAKVARETTHVFWGEFGDVTVTEGNDGTTSLALRIFSSPAAKKAIKITGEFAIAGTGSGFADGDDFNAVPFTATIPKGQASTTVHVTINGDLDVEPDEVFSAIIKSATGAVIDNGTLPVTILNDDQGQGGGLPKVSFQTSATTVTTEEGASQEFTLKLDEVSEVDVTVTINLATASKSDTGFDPATIPADASFDDQSTSMIVTIPAGQLTATFEVPLTDDNITETTEGYKATIVSAIGATPQGKTTQFAAIIDNDAAPDISIDVLTEAQEGNVEPSEVLLNITLSHATDHDVTVHYASATDKSVPKDRRAKKNKDFQIQPGTAVIPAGQTSVAITVQVLGDTIVEQDENFLVKLSKPNGATLNPDATAGTVTIIDDEDV